LTKFKNWVVDWFKDFWHVDEDKDMDWEDRRYEDFEDEQEEFDGANWRDEYPGEWVAEDFRNERREDRRERDHEGRRKEHHKKEGRHGRHLSSTKLGI
jgi:hypothetical protein